ncbi:hypothetical protein GC163_24595 [bacterium]|nr:hypothetical protein [bacterium]
MKRLLKFSFMTLCMLTQAISVDAGTKINLLWPGYLTIDNVSATEAQWNRIIDAHVPGVCEVMIIANINSGPNYPAEWAEEGKTMYLRVFRRAEEKGVPVVGYVATNYGARSRRDVISDITRWRSWGKAIVGVFLDQQPTDPRYVRLYQSYRKVTLRTFGPSGQVVTNPGTFSPAAAGDLTKYLTTGAERSVADVMVLYNGSGSGAAAFFDAYDSSIWTQHQAAGFVPDRFAVLIHSQPVLENLQKTSDDQIRWAAVTDLTPPNEWGQLPSYFDQEVARVKEINSTAASRYPEGHPAIDYGLETLDSVNLWLEKTAVMRRGVDDDLAEE